MLNTRQVDHYAASSRVDRLIAEKDIVLTYVLKTLEESSTLKHLAFKGGTCIRKIFLRKTGRFSEDLDFTAVDIEKREFREMAIRAFSGSIKYGISYSVFDEYSTDEESYGAYVDYSHDWNKGQFKFEVSFREKPILPLLPASILEELYFKYTEFKTFTIDCLRKEEVLEEKIRAAYQRANPRDYYDLYLFSEEPYNREVVKKLVFLKLWNAFDPFDPKMFLTNIKKLKIDFFSLKNLVREGKLPNNEEIVENIAQRYMYLDQVDLTLKRIKDDSKRHQLKDLVMEIKDDLVRTIQS